MKIVAPGKINLFLRITRRRTDGYHDIETIFMPLRKPYDEIVVTDLNSSSKSPVITSSNNSIPLNESNLCYKAAVEFAKVAGIAPSWNIDIQKDIPVAAGLGGGSSDAAAVLMKLKEKYTKVDSEKIFKIACSLGADVPFFLNPVPSFASGRGEIIQILKNIPEIQLVIVNPLFPVSAAWAYSNHIPDNRDSSSERVINALQENNIDKLAEVFRNDLQIAIFRKFPIMSVLQKALLDFGAEFAEMSGSGPTLFAVCKTQSEAANIAREMKARYSDSIYCIATSTKTFFSQIKKSDSGR